MSGYIGTAPVPQATQHRETFIATASQTTFATAGYTPEYLDVYLNGVHLLDVVDYTASNGSDVVLTSGATVSDVVEVLSFTAFEVVYTAVSRTWTPVISDSATGGNVATATVTDAVYRDIGGMIHAKCKLKNIGTAGMTGSSNIYIQGLPIAAESDSEGIISHAYFTPDAAGIGLIPSVDEGTTYIKLKELRTGTTFVNANVNQFATGTADMWISIVYPS